jgi:hypothetical protein
LPIGRAGATLRGSGCRSGAKFAAADLLRDEVGDLCRADLLKAVGFDAVHAAIALGGEREYALAGCLGDLAAGDFQFIADLAERLAEVVHVCLGTLGGFDGANVLHLCRDDLANGRACGKRIVDATELGGFELPQFVLGDLSGLGAKRLPANYGADVPLQIERAVVFD